MRYTLPVFEQFLKGIDLNSYRERFTHIKTVEMDLPKNIQALDAIYDIYWNKDHTGSETPLSFDDFYEEYYNRCKDDILSFGPKVGYGSDCDCFKQGLKARIYRTWASLITQIHAGYVAESVFGEGTIDQSTDLDHKGIDLLANYKNNEIKIQIKKESKRPEISRMHRAIPTADGFYNIWYVVPKQKDYEDPYYKAKNKEGQLRNSVKPFIKYNPENGTLDRYDNGFVVFTKKEFELIKKVFD